MTSNSKNIRKFEGNHINMEYLPNRIQSKIIHDIENFSGNQSTVSIAPSSLPKNFQDMNFQSNDYVKHKDLGIITKRTESPDSLYSDDSVKIAKKSPMHILEAKTLIEPSWINQADDIIKNSIFKQSLRVINDKLKRIILNHSYSQDWAIFNEYRRILQPMVINIFEKDLRFSCENNLDSYFWKSLFYNVLQYFKNQQKHVRSDDLENLKRKILYIVEDGIIFYKNFIFIMESRYNFQANSLLQNTSQEQKISSLIKVTIQKFYLNLGDLHRYQAQLESGNIAEARKYYLMAQKLIPGNGVPYNQLAIIALNFNNYFHAVYYHIRSLTASNPIISAKETLKILLDEIRKKYDDKFKSINETINTSAVSDNSNFRKEIWIHPNGSRRLRFQSDTFSDTSAKEIEFCSKENTVLNENILLNSDMDLNEMSHKKLKKEFISSYLYIVSKLYIGVDLETFENAMLKMLYEFSNAINRYPSLLNQVQLLEITAINIFLYDYNTNKISNQEDLTNTNEQIRNHSFMLGLLMFGITINRANDVLEQYIIEWNERKNINIKFSNTDMNKASKTDSLKKEYTKDFLSTTNPNVKLMENLPTEFAELLQPIKIWCEWLKLNLHLCNLTIRNYYQQITPWRNFANLLTSLSKIFGSVINSALNEDVSKLLLLEENLYLMGFGPLKTVLSKTVNCKIKLDEKNASILYRINEIIEFAINSLCSNDISILNVEKDLNDVLIFTKNCQTFQQPQTLIASQNNSDKDNSNESDDYDEPKINTEEKNLTILNNGENDEENDSSEYNKLKNKKMLLEKSKKAQELYKEKLKNILEDVGNFTIIEVKPRYLVPDTNCFIDFLDELEYLVNTHNSYTLMVPLVVINELEGLTKGFKMDLTREMSWKMANSRIHHFDEVARISEQSLNFIKNKNRINIRCCTTRGSILKNSSTFTIEEDSDNIFSNDDKILTSALSIATDNYIKKESEKSYIRTEVVLLTTDRNLRVKALAKNLAVSGLKEFLSWTEQK